jgi:hypothetical protein
MISNQSLAIAAARINCSAAAVYAVTHVEASGMGFWKSGKIILKFEGHVFHKLTGGAFDHSNPTISYPAWTERYTEYGEAGYKRFDVAFGLNPHAALMATSWGMFQIMGENYSSCGFSTVDAFVTSMKLGEDHQLLAFCTYVKTQGLDKYLRTLDWAGFALRYNGTGYRANHYDTLLAKYYHEFLTLNN